MKPERTTNWFPYLYAIMVMIGVQFLAMLYLVGRIENELNYLKFEIRGIQAPVRNEVVTVTFGMEDEVDPFGIGGGYGDGGRDPKLFTVFNGRLYEMKEMR